MPRLNKQNVNTQKPQDDWQRRVNPIQIQLKQLTTEPDSTPQSPQSSNSIDISQQTYYELLRTSITSCNKQKQPLLDDDLTDHIQFDQERSLSYLPISTSLTLKENATCTICRWTSKNLHLMVSSIQEH